jgi:hypothetical protein
MKFVFGFWFDAITDEPFEPDILNLVWRQIKTLPAK